MIAVQGAESGVALGNISTQKQSTHTKKSVKGKKSLKA